MKRASLTFVILFAGTSSAACDIPAAVFDGGSTTTTKTTTSDGGSGTTDGGSAGQTTATHPTGGSGGTTGGTGGTTGGTGGEISTTTAMGGTGGGPFMGPVVLCAPNKTACNPYEVCCLYPDDQSGDHCDQPGACGGMFDVYEQFACDGPEDCPGAHCCLHFGILQADSQCKPTCPTGSDDYQMCTDSSQCTAPQNCYFLQIGYDYAVCADPP